MRRLELVIALARMGGTNAYGLQDDKNVMVKEFIKKFEEINDSQDIQSIMDTVIH